MKRYEKIALIVFALILIAAFIGAAAMAVTEALWSESLLIGSGVCAAVLIGAVVRRWEKENGGVACLFWEVNK